MSLWWPLKSPKWRKGCCNCTLRNILNKVQFLTDSWAAALRSWDLLYNVISRSMTFALSSSWKSQENLIVKKVGWSLGFVSKGLVPGSRTPGSVMCSKKKEEKKRTIGCVIGWRVGLVERLLISILVTVTHSLRRGTKGQLVFTKLI